MCMQGECNKDDTMPLMLELKYEYFTTTWPGRIKLLELVSAPILPILFHQANTYKISSI